MNLITGILIKLGILNEDLRSGAFGSLLLFATRGRKESFALCHGIVAVG
jgi:hypothetical protein